MIYRKLLLTGAAGLLGTELRPWLASKAASIARVNIDGLQALYEAIRLARVRAGPSPKLLLAAATLIAIVFVLLPMLWAISTSLKTEVGAVAFPPSFLPRPLSLAAYWRVVTEQDFLAELSNSTRYSVGGVALALLVAAPAGYAAARFDLPGKSLIMMTVLATSMIPTAALLIPLYGLLARIGLLNSALGPDRDRRRSHRAADRLVGAGFLRHHSARDRGGG